MKKKIISVLLASMMVIGLVGCGGSKKQLTAQNPILVTD